MENELTRTSSNPYPVSRRDMDDNVEKKEDALDPTVGKPKEEQEKDAAEKEQQEKERLARIGKTISKQQQENARKAWEEFHRRAKDSGQEIPESLTKQQESYIQQGLTPRQIAEMGRAMGGASDGAPFADFDADKYKDNAKLFEMAQQLKESGRREEISQDKLREFDARLDLLVSSGDITEDQSQRFKSDINETIVKSNSPKEEIKEEVPSPSPEVRVNKKEPDLSGDLGFENIRELLKDITDPTKEADIVNTVETLKQSAVELAEPFFEKREKQAKAKELNDILKIQDPLEFQRRLAPFLELAVARRRKNYAEGKVEVPSEITSIQGLAKFIMNRQESQLYGPFKKYALIDYEPDPVTGEQREIFRPDNFLIWVRDQIMQLHDDNRTGEMQPLSAVAIETQLRTVSIYMMNRFRGQYFRDEHTGKIMDELADNAVNMCYLFGFFRNMDLAYRQVMNSDDDLPKTIVGIHAKNDVTHDDNWAQFLSMPDKFGAPVIDAEGKATTEKDTKVGDAELVANDIYYNLSDIDELKDILGEKSSFMTKEGFKKALLLKKIIGGERYEWETELDDQPGLYDKAADNFYTLDTDTGKKKYVFDGEKINHKNYHDFINFYNAPTPDKTNVDFVRDLIRLAIAEKVGIETGYSQNAEELEERKSEYEKIKTEKTKDDADEDYKRKVKAGRINTRFAEYSAFVQQRPLMIAARNDVNRRGYDASTKLDINYIIRQSGANTAGPIGSSEFLKHQIIKNFAVDFVAGLKTENKRSPYEIFRDIRHTMNDQSLTNEQREKKKTELLAQLRFQDNAALDYSSNAIKRSYDIFHQVTEAQSLDLNKIVTRNMFEGIKFKTAEFEKQLKDDFIKPMRYAFSSNSALKYGEEYRGFERMKGGLPVYRWKTLADHMFGDEVLDDIRMDAKKNKLKLPTVDENGNEVNPSKLNEFQRYKMFLNGGSETRSRLVKNIARARIAGELRKHRNRWGAAERWNADMINKFILALESVKEFEKNEDGHIVETSKKFFTDKDISWIRKNSGTGYKSMAVKEGLAHGGVGFFKGIFEGFEDFFENTFKG